MNNIEKFANITVREIEGCYEDVTLTGRWLNNPHSTGKYCYLIFGFEGQSDYETKYGKYSVSPNDILFLPADTVYSGYSPKIPSKSTIIVFEIINDEVILPFSFSPDDVAYYAEIMQKMIEKYRIGGFGYKAELNSYLYKLIYKISTGQETGSKTSALFRKIKNSVLYIHRNYDKYEINVEQAARESNMSAVHLRRIFAQIYKIPPHKYINMLRIKKAKELLLHTDYTINEITFMTGFGESSYFSRTFRKTVGMTPLEFRRKGSEV